MWNVWKSCTICSQNCVKGLRGEQRGDTTVNKAVGPNRVQLLPRCWTEHSKCCLFSGLPVEKHSRSLLYSGKRASQYRRTRCSEIFIIWLSCCLSTSLMPQQVSLGIESLTGKCFLLMENCLAFSCISHEGVLSISLIMLSLSHSVSNGPRDEPEPGAHALCHRLRFLW